MENKIAELLVQIEAKDIEYADLNDVYKDLQIDSDDKMAELQNQKDTADQAARDYEKHCEDLEEQLLAKDEQIIKMKNLLIDANEELQKLKDKQSPTINAQIHKILLDQYVATL